MGGQQRKFPVYLLLDCSSSMSGAPIIAVNEGLELLYKELMRDPQARESVWISLVRFATTASQDPLTPIDQFVPPTLSANGSTAMGGAFQILADSIQHDLAPRSGNHRGDYRPLVFLLTDGAPTDNWKGAVQNLKALTGSQRPIIVALGCGNGVNAAMLKEVTDEVYLMANVTTDQLKQFFKLMSGSIVGASKAAVAGAETGMQSPAAITGVIKYSP